MTTMQRQHFELIAQILCNYQAGNNMAWANGEYIHLCTLFANYLQYTNNAFDRKRFFEGCGIATL